jgi:predicted aldo/keto reductase-like oxidoreductase
MIKRVTRKTGDSLSLLGFGCMRFPKIQKDKQDIDYAAAQEMIDYAYSHGVNYYDTAYPYHEGMSETFVGHALKKYPRESFYLADKMPSWLLNSLEDGKRIFEEQLKKCQVDYFDFYLCHSIGGSVKEFENRYEKTGVLSYLREEKARGRIRHLGFSFHGVPEVLEELADRHEWDFIQIQLNYLDWDMQNAKRQYEILEKRGIPCVVMEPVRGGSLCSLCEEAVSLLKTEQPERSLASWAIRFAASLPNVMTVLSGMSTLEQVEDNVNTMTDFEPLTDCERSVLGEAVAVYLKTGTIPCTGCRYCMDCPSGVDIPAVFAAYNRCASAGRLPLSTADRENAGYFREAYESLPEAARADRCVGCEACMQHCPQRIKIPSHMQEIVQLASNCR